MFRLMLIVLVGFLCFAAPVWADGGLPVLFLLLPAIPSALTMSTFGLTLLIIIAVEAPVLRARCGLSHLKAYALTAWANVFSTITGIAIVLMFGPYDGNYGLAFPLNRFIPDIADSMRREIINTIVQAVVLIGGAILFGAMFKAFYRKAGYFQGCAQHKIKRQVLGGASLLIFPGCYLLIQLSVRAGWLFYKVPFPHDEALVDTFMALSLLLFGFMLTVIAEGFIVTRFVPENQPKIVSTVVLMNVISYGVLVIGVGLVLLLTFLTGGFVN